MHLDHLSFAVGPAGLHATTAELSEKFGAVIHEGGVHPRFGTTNMILPLKNRQYLQVVAPLEHPAADKAPYGQAVKARTELGGGWMGWCVSVEDIGPVEHRLGRHSVPGNRHRPDGFNLTWRQIGVNGMRSDPQLPYVMCWDQPEEHPSTMAESDIELVALEIAGSPERLQDWLGEPAVGALEQIEVRWVAPNGVPGILAAEFETPSGRVRL